MKMEYFFYLQAYAEGKNRVSSKFGILELQDVFQLINAILKKSVYAHQMLTSEAFFK